MTTAATSEAAGTRLGRPFRLFQSAVLCSDLGDGIYRIAVPLLALALTPSAFAVSAVGVAMRLPWLLVTLPAGVLVDRWDPDRLMRRASLLRIPLVALLGVAAVAGRLPLWALAVGAFLVGAAGTVVDLAAQSLPPRLVDTDLLPRANAALQTVQTVMAQFLGPTLGGVVAALGASGGIGASAVLYVLTLLLLGFLRMPGGASAAGDGPPAVPRGGSLRSLLSDAREGLRYFRRRRDLVHLASVAASGNLAYAAAVTVLPLWAVDPGPLGLPLAAYGALLAAPTVGGVLAGLWSAKVLARFGSRRVLQWCAPALGVCFMALAFPHPAVTVVALAASGALSMTLNVMNVSYRQTSIPEGLFGRVNAAYRWIIWGVLPLGSLVAGVLSWLLGTAWVFLCTGALALAAGCLPARGVDAAARTHEPAAPRTG